MSSTIKEYLSQVIDPREEYKCKHLLSDILAIGLCSYLSGGEDYEDMVLFAQIQSHLLPELIKLPNGIPSHDTFNRVFQILNPSVLNSLLVSHGKDFLDVLAEKQIAIDGKKLRGVSPTSRGNKGLYIVNAWVSENRLCIGQQKVADKTNEITAIPEVLSSIDITDAVVSIDAIGGQSAIASQIRDQQGHYFLAIKANQSVLLENIKDGFLFNQSISTKQEWEYDHGRYETRICSILSAQSILEDSLASKWKDIQTLVKVEATRLVNGKTSTQTRFYISDENVDKAEYFNKLARGHWGIENQLHWHLDVNFKEDACRARKGNAPENLSTLRKLALQMISQVDDKLSIRKRRLKAALDINYLKKVLQC